MNPLLRYWLFPGFWRRLNTAWKCVFLIAVVALTLGVAFLIIRANGQSFINGPLLVPAGILFISLPSLLVLFGAFAGGTLIASERQRQTWDTLLLSTLSVRTIVIQKVIARLVFCALLAAPVTLWLVAVLYHVAPRSGGLFTVGGSPSRNTTVLRIVIFLIWTFFDVLLHLVPGLAFGTALSARSRKVTHALLIGATVFIAYGYILFVAATTAATRSAISSQDPDLLAVLLRWPLIPYLSGQYPEAHILLPSGWWKCLVAELLWALALSALFLRSAIARSGLSERTPAR